MPDVRSPLVMSDEEQAPGALVFDDASAANGTENHERQIGEGEGSRHEGAQHDEETGCWQD